MIKHFVIEKLIEGEELYKLVYNFEYKKQPFGEELDFALDEELSNILSSFNGGLKPGKSILRKPGNTIHCEEYPPNLIFKCMLALSDTTIKFYRHKDSNSEGVYSLPEGVTIQSIFDDAIFNEKFEEIGMIKLKAGEICGFNPWLWHNVKSNLVQLIDLEVK